jgi:hypothetical protein
MSMIAVLATTLASAAAAQAYPADVAGWLVVRRPEGCAMGTQFAGPGNTYLVVHKRVGGDVYLSITNDRWSAREDEPYKVSYQVNGREYSDGTTVGYRSGSARGFWSSMGAGFERDLAAGTDLSVFLDGEFIRKLSLRGTGAALAAVDRCVAGLRSQAPAGRREKGAEVPKDPFAKPSPQPPTRRAPAKKSRP